ncbi:UDENN domain-containing protein [Entamoeba marina]
MSSSDLSFSDAIHNIPARALSYSNSSERFGRQNHRHKPTPSEYTSMFTGFFVVEFDLEDGEVVIYKQLSNELNNGVEKELVRVLMGCDYSADSCSLTPQISDSQISDPPKTKQNLILTHSIMNFHCISVHFSVYNPSNKRGFVSTACISLLQSRQFSCQQAKCVKEELQKYYWRGTTQTFDVPLSLTELINIASQSETALGGIFNLYSKLLMNSHINTSYDSYFSNITSPSTVLTLGNFALCNTNFSKPDPRPYPFPAIFPLYQPVQYAQVSPKYSFVNMIQTMPKIVPHLLLTLLSGCRLVVFQSQQQLDAFKLKEIAEFLSSLCIGGVSSTQHDLYLNDDKTRDGQITVLSTHTYNGHDSFLDLSKGFKGLYYEGKGLLENFVVHAKNFVRKMETEREANKTGRIVPKHPVFSPPLFKYISK